MRKKSDLRLILMTAAVITGLLLPIVVANMQDALSAHTWRLRESDAHYVYSGTLRNRALALNSYRNGSHMVKASTAAGDAEAMPDCRSALAEARLVPPCPNDCQTSTEAFSLEPANYAARYEYINVQQNCGESRMNATVDAEKSLCLVVELHCGANELAAWRGETSLMELLSRFAAYWGFEGISEGRSTYAPSGICSQNAVVTGTYYEVSVLTVPERGFLMYRLSAR